MTREDLDRPALEDFFEDMLRGLYPNASSSGDSSGVPQTLHMTVAQSPHTSGSVTAFAQVGHQRCSGVLADVDGVDVSSAMLIPSVA